MIAVNFSSRDYRLHERIFVSLLIGSAALIIVLAGTVRAVMSTYSDTDSVIAKVTELSKRDMEIQPLLVEREQVLKDISAMSGLIEMRRFSWTGLFTDVESVFPEGVALDRMAFNPKDKSLSLEGRAQSFEALRGLVAGLEKSARFKNPLLRHQSVDKGAISFTVGMEYHE